MNKQQHTAVEFLEKYLETALYDIDYLTWKLIFSAVEKAKEMEKQQQDNFAIGFAEWLIEKEREHPNRIIRGKELLEIYKKEKGL